MQLRIITHSGSQLAVDVLPPPLLPPPRPRTPSPPSAPLRAGKPSQPPTQQPPPLPSYQLVPSLPSTTTEATTGYSWSRSFSALASLPAYATATAATAVGAAAGVGGAGSMLGASAGAGQGPLGEPNHHHQQQQQQQQPQGLKQGGPGQPQGDAGVGDGPGRQQPHPRGVAGGEEQGALHHQQQFVERNGPLGAGDANELLTFFIVSPKMVCVAHPRDANDRVLWLIEVGRFEEALNAAEDGLRAARGLTNGDIAQGKDNGAAADGLGVSDLAGPRGESDDGQGPGVGSYGVTQETYDKAVQAFIGWLLSSGSFERAASMSWRLLGRSASAWERWVYLFAQARHLPLLAPHLPTESPRLRSGLYDIVLASLLSQPEHHATALKMVRSWPPSLFSMPQLMEAVASRMKRPGGESRELALIMAELYERQARPDLALATYLNLRDPRALELLEAGAGPAGRGAAALLAPRQSAAAAAAGGVAGPAAVAALLELDEDRALDALVRHVETLPPAHVVDALQDAELNWASDHSSTDKGTNVDGESKRKLDAAQRLRKSLWKYLAAVMSLEPTALSPQHAHLAIVLAAEYAPPGKLLDMLSGSGGAGAPLIPLESALAVCEEHNMVAEQVYLLGRMGNASRALHLIINKLEDIPQAIEFVRGQRDDELWEQLMSWALGSPETTGALLDHIGGHINPLSIIRRLPTGTSIPRLRDRVISIIADFRTQTSLHEGCNTILRADCAHLMAKFYASIRAQVPTVYIKCSSWHALQHHQNLRRLLGASSHSSTLHAGAGGVWLRYGAPVVPTGASPTAHPHHHPVLQPLVGPQDLPQGLLSAMQHTDESSGDDAGSKGTKYQSRLGAATANASRRSGSAYSRRAWVGCIAPDAAAEDAPATAPTGSSPRVTMYGASNSPKSKSTAKRQQRQHAYLHPRFPSSSSTADLPALVHMS
ncbi:hypothetical protein DUNSADRAFT_6375 [Dunaliella salina]|uniref:Uncharacterized protein n=1 Tax=Dunaliella salina TaxID=3046 RepID=A0ABQ7GND9_DUNSA|nr:hypothetical protein DUNSADRAFT_6375 [Dunaliella salina]|eukprot:KAF5836122.1 hypothetical protein DUNSADRAFT_6375 [Dunaliella salina]